MDSFLFFSSLLFFLWRWSGPPWTPQTWLHALPYLWLFKNTHTHRKQQQQREKELEKQQQDVIDLRAKTTLFINRFFFSAYFFKKWPIIKKEFCFVFLTLDNATWWIAERYSVYVKERKNFYPSLIDFLFISLLYNCIGVEVREEKSTRSLLHRWENPGNFRPLVTIRLEKKVDWKISSAPEFTLQSFE